MSEIVKAKYCRFCGKLFNEKGYIGTRCHFCGHDTIVDVIAIQNRYHVVKDAEIIKEEPLK